MSNFIGRPPVRRRRLFKRPSPCPVWRAASTTTSPASAPTAAAGRGAPSRRARRPAPPAHAEVPGGGDVEPVAVEGLGDRGFQAPRRAPADGAGERDAGAGELADGVLGGAAGVVDEL